jgi:thiol-disulfide isomerase/thioredoxin
MTIRFTFFLAILFTASTAFGQLKKQAAAGADNDLPPMMIKGMDGKQYAARDLKGNVVIIMFQPDCDHCQREAKQIHDNLAYFKDYHLYFLAAAAPVDVQRFANDYQLMKKPNVHFGITTVNEIINSYGPIDAPSLYIYSKDRKLVKKFNGETDIAVILKAL